MAKTNPDPFAEMHARCSIDDAQRTAGLRFADTYEAARDFGERAFDPTREVVDGSPPPSNPINARGFTARTEMIRLRAFLRPRDFSLLEQVIIERRYPSHLAEGRGGNVKLQGHYLSESFSDALDDLVEFYGLVRGPASSPLPKKALPVRHYTAQSSGT